MFSREVDLVCEIQVCSTILPTRGSEHPAFLEMLFLWGDPLETDPRFRQVVLPSGFSFVTADLSCHEVKDLSGNVRATVHTPSGRLNVPSIVPVKRYAIGTEIVDKQHRGVAFDRGNAVYRTRLFNNQQDAVLRAKEWLDDNKPRWDSYTSAVNFD